MPAVLINAALGSFNAAATLPTSFTVTLSNGTGTPGVGDLVVIVVSTMGATGAPNTPAGWTLLSGSPFTNATSGVNRMWVYYRVRQAGDTNSVAFTATAGGANETYLAQAYYFGGVDPTNPIEVAAVKTESTVTSAVLAGPLTGATSLAPNAIAVAFWHRADDAGTFSTSSVGWTHNSDTNAVASSTLGNDAAMGMATKRMPTASPSGTFQLDVATGAAAHWLGIVVILKGQTGTGLLTATAEGWTDEAVVTAQTSTDPVISIVSGAGTTKADNAFAQFGTMSYRHDLAATQQRLKINCDIPGTVQYGAFIFRASAWPSASNRISSLEDYSGPDHCQIQHQSDGGWRIAGTGGSPFSSASTTKTPVNQAVRLEWRVDTVAATAELRIFALADIGNDISSPTETLTLTGLSTTGEIVGRGMFGAGVANYASASLWYDNPSVRYDNWVNLQSPGTAGHWNDGTTTWADPVVTWNDSSGGTPTNASAGVATGTGTAQTPQASVKANAGVATGTGTAQTPQASVKANAGVATGTGTAYNPTTTASGNGSAGVATGVGTAYNPTTTASGNGSAGVASGTGVAQTPQASIKANAGVAAGTGTAQTPQTSVKANAGVAAGTGTAYNPTASITNNTFANAGVATGVGTAYNPTVSASGNANAGVATGTGVAQTPSARLLANAGVALGAFMTALLNGGLEDGSTPLTVVDGGYAGYFAAPLVRDNTDSYDGTWSINTTTNSAVNVQGILWFAPQKAVVPAGVLHTAGIAVKGPNGTVVRVGGRNCNPDGSYQSEEASFVDVTLTGAWQYFTVKPYSVAADTIPGLQVRLITAASGVLLKFDNAGVWLPTRADIKPSAGIASGTGTAYNPSATASGNALAGVATGTGVAQTPRVDIKANTGVAAGAGTAQTPRADVQANAGVATGAGTAYNPTASTSGNANANAGVATGAGTAYNPTISASGSALAGVATGVGTAQAPSTSVKANAGVATGTGTAQTPRADVKPGAGVATGAGTAYNPSTTASGNALAGVATGVGTAYNPTGSSANATYANAGSAAGTGTAYGPSVSISPSPQVAWGRATNLLTPNQSAIEVDASGWTSSFNPGALPYTMVKATDQIHDKSASLKVSFQGGTGAAQFNININPVASIPVVAAEALKGGIWIRSNVARTVSLNIDWFNSVPSYIISDTQTLALLANTWTQFAVSAPYRSPGAFASFTVSSNPVAGDILWIADGEIYKVQTAKASILPSAGLASGTGTAQTPRADIKANAGVATGVGTAYNPTASIGGAPANAPAGVATGAGTALGPTVKISANTQVATAVGTAYNPDISISTRANAGVATGAGIAYNPGVSLSKSGAAGVATATGTAYPAKPSIGAAAGCATGVGTAYDAMANIFIVGPSPDERVYHVVREHRIFVVERERRGIHVPFDPNRTTIVTERQGAHV